MLLECLRRRTQHFSPHHTAMITAYFIFSARDRAHLYDATLSSAAGFAYAYY